MQRFSELCLIHIVLVLADADRFRVDFHQLRKRVLQAARNRRGAPLPDVKLRKLFGREFARRIDRSACFIHNRVL